MKRSLRNSRITSDNTACSNRFSCVRFPRGKRARMNLWQERAATVPHLPYYSWAALFDFSRGTLDLFSKDCKRGGMIQTSAICTEKFLDLSALVRNCFGSGVDRVNE
jgi:hypothetical protein